MGVPPTGNGNHDDLRSQLDEMSERVAANRRDIDALTERADSADSRADKADTRADDADSRADKADTRADDADSRADKADTRADAADVRMDAIEAAAALDRELIEELHAAGVVSKQHAAQMEQALRSSRTIGTAIGILMASRGIGGDRAFALLQEASSRSNRKIRELAAEIASNGSTDIGTEHSA